jgi:hypothetical protein
MVYWTSIVSIWKQSIRSQCVRHAQTHYCAQSECHNLLLPDEADEERDLGGRPQWLFERQFGVVGLPVFVVAVFGEIDVKAGCPDGQNMSCIVHTH